MKTIFSLIFLISVATQSVANQFHNEFSAFYTGIGGGYSQQKFNDEYTQDNLLTNTTFTNTDHHNQHVGFGQLFAGYGLNLLPFLYTGIEGSFSGYSASPRFTPSNPFFTANFHTLASVSQEYGFQISFIPGLFITQKTLVYGRVGYGTEHYKTRYLTDIPVVLPKLNNRNQWISETVLGMGINQKISKKLSIRLEYNYVCPETIAGQRGETFGVPGPGPGVVTFNRHQDNFYLRSYNTLLSLVYYPSWFS